MKIPPISEQDWLILDSVVDCPEGLEHIHDQLLSDFSNTPIGEVQARLLRLCKDELLQVHDCSETPIDVQDVTASESEDPALPVEWFSLTKSGSEVWESESVTYTNEAQDWSDAFTINVDFRTQRGHVAGVTKEVCLRALQTHVGRLGIAETEIFKESSIDEFQAKYHKLIPGGYMVEFQW